MLTLKTINLYKSTEKTSFLEFRSELNEILKEIRIVNQSISSG